MLIRNSLCLLCPPSPSHHPEQHADPGCTASIESAISLKYCASDCASAEYHTVRPSLFAVSNPARAIRERWRATVEKSTEQHSATSVTEHALPHFSKHDSNLARVGSASALSKSGSSSVSSRARRRNACFGVGFFCLLTCVIMQVYRTQTRRSIPRPTNSSTHQSHPPHTAPRYPPLRKSALYQTQNQQPQLKNASNLKICPEQRRRQNPNHLSA